MEYAKDELYTVKYMKEMDKTKNHSDRNRFIFLLITLGIIFSIINFILIFNFFNILTKM